MTHSVLVTTAQELFAKFYQRLGGGEAMGEALDNARRYLYLNQGRGDRQRGDERITLMMSGNLLFWKRESLIYYFDDFQAL